MYSTSYTTWDSTKYIIYNHKNPMIIISLPMTLKFIILSFSMPPISAILITQVYTPSSEIAVFSNWGRPLNITLPSPSPLYHVISTKKMNSFNVVEQLRAVWESKSPYCTGSAWITLESESVCMEHVIAHAREYIIGLSYKKMYVCYLQY